MPDLTPALIGFCGVLFAGLIQAAVSLTKSRGDEAREIRQQVATFNHAAHMYFRRIQLLTRLSTEGILSSQSHEYQTQAKNELSQRYREVTRAAYELIASPDYRLSTRADALLEDFLVFAEGHAGLFSAPPKDWPSPTKLMSDANELTALVRPRRFERRWRFKQRSVR